MGEDWTERGDWLEGHLFDRRIVVLRGSLDDVTATRIASQLMTLDATGDDAVQLQLDCPGERSSLVLRSSTSSTPSVCPCT